MHGLLGVDGLHIPIRNEMSMLPPLRTCLGAAEHVALRSFVRSTHTHTATFRAERCGIVLVIWLNECRIGKIRSVACSTRDDPDSWFVVLMMRYPTWPASGCLQDLASCTLDVSQTYAAKHVTGKISSRNARPKAHGSLGLFRPTSRRESFLDWHHGDQ